MRKTLAYLLSITKIDRDARLNIFAYAMIGFVFIGIQGVLNNLYLIELGLDLSFVGTLTASGMLAWALFAIPAGMIGTRFGTRSASVIGFILVALAYALFLCVTLLPRSLWEIGFYVTNAITWMTASLVAVNGTPHLMAVSPEEQRNTVFTLGAALNAIAGFAGSLVAGFLPNYLTRILNGNLSLTGAYNAVLWITIPAYLGSALLMHKARSGPPIVLESGEASKGRSPWGMLLFLGFLFCIQLTGENFVLVFMNVYFSEELFVPIDRIGVIFAVVRLLPFFISPLLPLVLKRWGTGRVMAGSYVLVTLFIIPLIMFASWQAAAAGFILISLVSSMIYPARMIFSQEIIHPRWRTTMNAVLNICMAISNAVVGIVGGRIVPFVGFRGLFIIGVVLALSSVFLYIGWHLLSRRPQPSAPEHIAISEEQPEPQKLVSLK